MKGVSFKIDIIENVTKVFDKINTKVSSVNNNFKQTNSNIKVLPNSIAGLNQKLQILRNKQERAFTVQGIKHYRKEIDKTEKELRKLNKTARGSGLKNMFKGVGGKIAGIGAAYLGVHELARGISSTFTAVGDYEQLNVAFTTMLGNAEQAKNVISDLTEFSNITPFQPEQVNQAGKSLLAFGFSTEQLLPTLRQIGDISAGTGKDFNELTTIFGKAKIAGTLYAEDINQLIEAGIPIIDEFAKQLGVPASQVKKLASEGQISFDMLQTAFANMTSEGGKFGGLMEAQSQTLAGRWSTLVGKFNQMKITIGEALMPIFEIFMKYAFKAVDWLSKMFKGLAKAINGVALEADEAHGIMKTAFNIASFIKENIGLIKTLAVVIASVVAVIKIWTAVQWLLNIAMNANPIGLIVVGIAALIAGITLAWKHSEKFRGTILGLWESMKLLADIMKTIIIDRIKIMLQGIGEIAKALELLTKGDFSGAWESLKKGASDYLGFTTVRDVVDKSKGFKSTYLSGYQKGQDKEGALINNNLSSIIENDDIDQTADGAIDGKNLDFSASTLPGLPSGSSPAVVGDVQGSGIKNINITIGSLVKEVTNYFRDTDTVEDADSFMTKLSGALQSVVNDVNYAV